MNSQSKKQTLRFSDTFMTGTQRSRANISPTSHSWEPYSRSEDYKLKESVTLWDRRGYLPSRASVLLGLVSITLLVLIRLIAFAAKRFPKILYPSFV